MLNFPIYSLVEEQADEDGMLITVSRQWYDEVTNFLHAFMIKAIEGITFEVVKNYCLAIPAFSIEEFDGYSLYKDYCLDLGHDYCGDICEIVRKRLVEGDFIEKGNDEFDVDIDEIVWEQVSAAILADIEMGDESPEYDG